MFVQLPETPDAFCDANWDHVAPYYQMLTTAPLTRESAPEWLEAWSTLEELVGEAGTLAMIAYTGDTTDPVKEARYLRFASEICEGVILPDSLRRPRRQVRSCAFVIAWTMSTSLRCTSW